jgi:MoaA/NifB/PqqE/SkfB family radical SAM enzyme
VSLWLEIEKACNWRCTFCYNPWRESTSAASQGHRLVLGAYANGLDRLLELRRFDYVAVSGGEPTLSASFFPLVELAASHQQRVTVTTNGTRLTEQLCSRLVALGVRTLQISMLGIADETHRALGGSGSWVDPLRGVLCAVNAGLKVGVTTVVSAENRTEVPLLAQLLAEIGVSRFTLNRLQTYGRRGAAPTRPQVTEDDFAHIVREANGRASAPIVKTSIGHEMATDTAWRRLTVAPSGALKLCNGALGEVGHLEDEDASNEQLLRDLEAGLLSRYANRVTDCACFELRQRRSGHADVEVSNA